MMLQSPFFSRFRDLSVDDRLFYDVGNNMVSAAVSPRGAIHKALIFTGSRLVARRREKGVWAGYNYLNFCRDTSFSFKTTDEFIDLTRKGLHQDASLILGAFPLITVTLEPLKIRQMVVAPFSGHDRLRALLVGFHIETDRPESVAAVMKIPEARQGLNHKGDAAGGLAEFILLDGLDGRRKLNQFEFTVRRGEPVWIPLLLVMGESAEDYRRNLARVKDLASEALIADTLAFYSRRIPEISFDGDPAAPLYSIIRRGIYAALITPLLDGEGRSVGCAASSDTSEPTSLGSFDFVWTLDVLYNHLYASMISPDSLLYGLQVSMAGSVPHWMPLVPKHDETVPEKDRRPWSLSNAMVPAVLAGAYYSLTGDGATLARMEGTDPVTQEAVPLRTALERLLDALLRTRDESEPMLFESRWLSDGHSEGKYHTGSNILAWYAYESTARLLREVFHEREKAEAYGRVARRMKEDLRRFCTIEHRGKLMYVEGHQAPLMHDGEEAATTIAAFLGFCPQDDPAMLNYKRFGCSTENPHWNEAAGGIGWCNQITFPGFITHLAACDSQEQLEMVLHRITGLADVDGQWWWWPMDPKDPGQTKVVRGTVYKCGYGTGLFLVRFINSMLGVQWDAPTRNLTFRPFVPWKEFDCAGLNVGSLRLNLSYANDGGKARVVIGHDQEVMDRVRIILRAPVGATECRMIGVSAKGELTKGSLYYDKPTWEVLFKDVRESPIVLELEWH